MICYSVNYLLLPLSPSCKQGEMFIIYLYPWPKWIIFANPLHIYWCLGTLTQLIHLLNNFFNFHPADIYIYICMYVCIHTYIHTYTHTHTYIYPPNIGVKHLREKEKGEANGSYSLLVLLLVWGMAPLERERNLWSNFFNNVHEV
jgi:hypothetical protein